MPWILIFMYFFLLIYIFSAFIFIFILAGMPGGGVTGITESKDRRLMYHGEVNVAQEELNSFFAIAELLRIKGLTQNHSENPSKSGRKSLIVQLVPPQPLHEQHGREPCCILTDREFF